MKYKVRVKHVHAEEATYLSTIFETKDEAIIAKKEKEKELGLQGMFYAISVVEVKEK